MKRTAQGIVEPFAAVMTVVLVSGAWMEILTHGQRRFDIDLSKFYLGIMAAYAGAAEITKWMVNIPTNSQEDPRFEKMQRGGFFIWFWMAPLLTALIWRVFDQTIPMPKPVMTITSGLVAIFFLKVASRQARHKKHGVIDDDDKDGLPSQPTFDDLVYKKVAASANGLAVNEIIAAFPDTSPPTLYRAFDRLVKANRLTRTGKPRTPDVRYHASGRQ